MGGNKNKFKASSNPNDVFSESDYNSEDVTTVPMSSNEFFNSYTESSSNSSTLPSARPLNNDFISGSNSFAGPSTRPFNASGSNSFAGPSSRPFNAQGSNSGPSRSRNDHQQRKRYKKQGGNKYDDM
jgi:hypothetical protein